MTSLAGHLRLRAAGQANGRTVLTEQSFRAPYHISKPYWDPDARTLLVQVVNPTAGVLAGDQLECEVSAGSAASLLVTTPSASRVFTMHHGRAECRQRFTVAPGAWLEVSPEPLVPHRGSDYRQITEVEVESGGGLLLLEQLLPGRIAHGEAWEWRRLSLALAVRVDGTLIAQERLECSGPELRELARFHGSGPSASFANAIVVPPREPPSAAWHRAIDDLHGHGLQVGVSALPGRGWIIRLIATDPRRLRDAVSALRRQLAAWLPPLNCRTGKG